MFCNLILKVQARNLNISRKNKSQKQILKGKQVSSFVGNPRNVMQNITPITRFAFASRQNLTISLLISLCSLPKG
jgi:hypothetical protein